MASADVVQYRCFAGGLSFQTTESGLRNAFSAHGDVTDCKIINDRETGRSRGFGFVTFLNEDSMRNAIEALNGQQLDGRSITVNEAQDRGSGGGGREGGYGRGGGGYGRGGGYRRGGYNNSGYGESRGYGGGESGGYGGNGSRGYGGGESGGYGGNGSRGYGGSDYRGYSNGGGDHRGYSNGGGASDESDWRK
ncbi:unnamed protein product [Cuscuta campestris]|uniref:RRM domain-containing protein n=1 Tax=Cuscuta campestris TaxID=132261 RepID=A0A484L713_9ASTE|nr:unnamed protein product [Cuscuta campestris]